jgi:hypothetical protein
MLSSAVNRSQAKKRREPKQDSVDAHAGCAAALFLQKVDRSIPQSDALGSKRSEELMLVSPQLNPEAQDRYDQLRRRLSVYPAWRMYFVGMDHMQAYRFDEAIGYFLQAKALSLSATGEGQAPSSQEIDGNIRFCQQIFGPVQLLNSL